MPLPSAASGAGRMLPVACSEATKVLRTRMMAAAAIFLIIIALLRRRRRNASSELQRHEQRSSDRVLVLPLCSTAETSNTDTCLLVSKASGEAEADLVQCEDSVLLVSRTPSPSNRVRVPAVFLQVSARQVFDVQWNFIGKELSAAEFKMPAGTDPQGGFVRPPVDQDGDFYRLIRTDWSATQFELKHYNSSGALKHQLTTYGQIKAISADVILYSGDAQYGTLITLKKEYDYGCSAKFAGLTVGPTEELVLHVFQDGRADQNEGAPASEETCIEKTSIVESCPRFNPKISSVLLRNLKELPSERKADFWWQPDDFAEFLKVRVQVGKAYRAAAKQLGVDILNVSSGGSHHREGHKEMIKAFPELGQESRRGLGLGRKKARASNRDAYIAAVLEEQKRQRETWEEAVDAVSGASSPAGMLDEEEWGLCTAGSVRGCASDCTASTRASSASEGSAPGPLPAGGTPGPFTLDAEALARVAQAISERDREYAHFLAQIYYEQDRLEMEEPNSDSTKLAQLQESARAVVQGESASSPCHCNCKSGTEEPDSPKGRRLRKGSDDLSKPVGEVDENLADDTEAEEGLANSNKAECKATPSKGFGVSREKLCEVGLSITGHAISRYQRLGATDGRMCEDSAESEAGTDCDA